MTPRTHPPERVPSAASDAGDAALFANAAPAASSIPAGPSSPGAPQPRPNVELHIEELALHGFPASARHAIGDAVQRELARIIAERGLSPTLAADGDLAYLDGGAFSAPSDASPDRIGVAVARAIYGGLSR